MARMIETIGGYAKADKVCGYCKFHEACLTNAQVKIHRCTDRGNHIPCPGYIPFEYSDKENCDSKLTGDAYRESLKRKHK